MDPNEDNLTIDRNKAKLGGNNRKNAQEQAKQAAKRSAGASSSQNVPEQSFRQIFLIAGDTIDNDWSTDVRQMVGKVLNQGDKDICWAICFARLMQAIYNFKNEHDQNEFSYIELVENLKPQGKDGALALANLRIACKYISEKGIMKMPTKGLGRARDKGKRVHEDFEIYEDVQAADILQKLTRFPVALRFELDPEFAVNAGEIYYLPKKKKLTDASTLHALILIGSGRTKEGKLYFIGQNSYGEQWGCKGYIRIVIEEKCDIIGLKE